MLDNLSNCLTYAPGKCRVFLKGFEPMTSAMPVQCFSQLWSHSDVSWSICWAHMFPWKKWWVKETFLSKCIYLLWSRISLRLSSLSVSRSSFAHFWYFTVITDLRKCFIYSEKKKKEVKEVGAFNNYEMCSHSEHSIKLARYANWLYFASWVL